MGNLVHYLEMVNNAQSYQDLVFLRNRIFDAMQAELTEDEMETVKQTWTERAKDESLPVVPAGQVRER